MRIAQISDFHFTCLTWNPLRLLSKRLLGNLNWLFLRQRDFSTEPLKELPRLLDSLSVDLILFGGDFTTTSYTQEFEVASDFVQRFSQPWIAIPGNHDKYTFRSDRNKHFYRYFSKKKKEIGHRVDFFTLKDHGIEVHEVAKGWWVFALDTALATNPYSSEGLFSEKLEAYLDEALLLIPPQDSVILLNHYPFFLNDEPRRSLRRGEALQNLIQRHRNIRLYLHGHTHRHTIADLQPNQLPIVLDSGSCGLAKKGSWNLIDLNNERCSVDVYQWKEGWHRDRTEVIPWKN